MLPRQFPRWVLETNSSRITNFPRPDPKSVSRAVMKTCVVIQHHCWGSNQETTHCVNSNSLTVKLLGFCCQLLTWKSFGSVSCLACHSPIQDLRNVFVRKLFQSFDLAVKELDLIVQGAHYSLALLAMQDLFHRVHQFPWHIMKAGVFFSTSFIRTLPTTRSAIFWALPWQLLCDRMGVWSGRHRMFHPAPCDNPLQSHWRESWFWRTQMPTAWSKHIKNTRTSVSKNPQSSKELRSNHYFPCHYSWINSQPQRPKTSFVAFVFHTDFSRGLLPHPGLWPLLN